jgi:Flp pilus assembly protein TadD
MNLLDRGKTADAVRELEEAQAARPDFDEIRSALASAYVAWAVEAETAGDFIEAVNRFSKALALEPDPEIENHAGVLLARSGRMIEAVARFRAALAARPGYRSAQQNLDRALSVIGVTPNPRP